MTSGGYLLDTDYVIDLLKGKQYAPTLLEKLLTNLSTHPQAGLSISIITFAEVYEGIYRGYAQKEHEKAFLTFTRIVEVYGITRPVAKRYALIRGELAQKGLSIDQPDLFIAATALHHDLTLVTNNRKDFERVPLLRLYKA